ncbi:hypothetical protein [Limnohabitans sp.]|uniref:hypothetical protein n=1 Tax=Limnohabitans sp. TaxID=1907725 RepID=UPI002FDD69B7
MAEETSQATQDPTSTHAVPEDIAVPAETLPASEAQTAPAPAAPTTPATPLEPDAIEPFIAKAFETIQHEVEDHVLSQFLRAHIKTFREEWDAMSDTAKDAYVHMMTSQLVQRKAAGTRIKNYEAYILPVPSAQTTLFESIQQTQVKPKKRQPVLLMPPNLRPTYALKK